MTPLQTDASGFTRRPRFDERVTHLIRSAERSISQNRLDVAREQLGLARSLDPKNSYINAIMERIHFLEHQPELGIEEQLQPGTAAPDRYLSVSVGPEFAGGIREIPAEPQLSPKEVQTRVRHLTTVAEKFLEQGSYENAFDSLMKAYLLDPVSPYVMTCEKSVLPVWENFHPMKLSDVPLDPSTSTERHTVRKFYSSHLDVAAQPDIPSSQSSEQNKRLELLKLQKEKERLERERAVWREASSPPRSAGQVDAGEQSTRQTDPPPEARGIFAKLKLGKFLE